MSFLSNIFKISKVECPRCLGKGNVDLKDIKRLKMELRWMPGSCAYCNGKGVVSQKLASGSAVDSAYLTLDLTPQERRLILRNDPIALERAAYFNMEMEDFIKQVENLHEVGKMDVSQIRDFFLISKTNIALTEKEIEEMEEYIQKVIEN